MRAVLRSGVVWHVPAVVIALFMSTTHAQGEKADIRGTLTNLTPASDQARKQGTLGSAIVEGAKEKDTNFDKASIRITKKSRIEKMVEGERKPAQFEDLKKGQKLQIRFVGPVAESYPVQATAGEILILEADL